MSIKIEVTNCADCPRLYRQFVRTADSWSHGHDWICTGIDGKDNRSIRSFVEWASEEPKGIPDWCPYRKEKEVDSSQGKSRILIESSEVKKAWEGLFPGFDLWPSQELMLKAIEIYQGQDGFEDTHTPLQVNMKMRSGATTLIKAIKTAYPEILTISLTPEVAEITGLDFNLFETSQTVIKKISQGENPLLNKTVIFDGALRWHKGLNSDIWTQYKVREVISLGS